MAEESLTGLKIKDTYEGLLHVSDGGISGNSGEAAVTKVYDGVGKSTCLEISKDYLKVIGDGKFESPLGDPILTIKSADGAVGIGTDNIVASAALDVRGGYIALDDNNSGVRGWVTQGTPGNGIGLAGGGQAGGVVADLYVAQDGNVGIGTESPGAMLEIKGDGSTKWGSIEIDTNGSGNSGFIDQGVLGTGIGLRGVTPQSGLQECDLYVTQAGNVGIGTESPGKKLHIVGEMRYEFGTPAVGQVLTCTNANGNVAWSSSETTGNSAYARFAGSNASISVNSGFSSIVRNSAGVYTLTFVTPRSSANSYVVNATREAGHPLEGDVVVRNRSTTSFVLHSSNDNSSAGDPVALNVTVVG